MDKLVSGLWNRNKDIKVKLSEMDRESDKSEAVPCSGGGWCQCGVIIVIYSTLQ